MIGDLLDEQLKMHRTLVQQIAYLVFPIPGLQKSTSMAIQSPGTFSEATSTLGGVSQSQMAQHADDDDVEKNVQAFPLFPCVFTA
uniref:Uncharacterized protein n=1 Tax=Arundo donax TaxID=35708 RepID=A0A0A9ECQ8_ARUDO